MQGPHWPALWLGEVAGPPGRSPPARSDDSGSSTRTPGAERGSRGPQRLVADRDVQGRRQRQPAAEVARRPGWPAGASAGPPARCSSSPAGVPSADLVHAGPPHRAADGDQRGAGAGRGCPPRRTSRLRTGRSAAACASVSTFCTSVGRPCDTALGRPRRHEGGPGRAAVEESDQRGLLARHVAAGDLRQLDRHAVQPGPVPAGDRRPRQRPGGRADRPACTHR